MEDGEQNLGFYGKMGGAFGGGGVEDPLVALPPAGKPTLRSVPPAKLRSPPFGLRKGEEPVRRCGVKIPQGFGEEATEGEGPVDVNEEAVQGPGTREKRGGFLFQEGLEVLQPLHGEGVGASPQESPLYQGGERTLLREKVKIEEELDGVDSQGSAEFEKGENLPEVLRDDHHTQTNLQRASPSVPLFDEEGEIFQDLFPAVVAADQGVNFPGGGVEGEVEEASPLQKGLPPRGVQGQAVGEEAETDPGVGLSGDLHQGSALRKNRGFSSLKDDLLHSRVEGKEGLRKNPGGDPPVKLLLVTHETTVVAG